MTGETRSRRSSLNAFGKRGVSGGRLLAVIGAKPPRDSTECSPSLMLERSECKMRFGNALLRPRIRDQFPESPV
jgi:hypothetical protein